mmetsp:Transcript_115002/g.365420  ORF Transcript_115002/g.365420 Transcript_115002/m.365420 type:complete len:82 (+) Transcript_115002:534-779(+)
MVLSQSDVFKVESAPGLGQHSTIGGKSIESCPTTCSLMSARYPSAYTGVRFDSLSSFGWTITEDFDCVNDVCQTPGRGAWC